METNAESIDQFWHWVSPNRSCRRSRGTRSNSTDSTRGDIVTCVAAEPGLAPVIKKVTVFDSVQIEIRNLE